MEYASNRWLGALPVKDDHAEFGQARQDRRRLLRREPGRRSDVLFGRDTVDAREHVRFERADRQLANVHADHDAR
jgi:hypothetical protein